MEHAYAASLLPYECVCIRWLQTPKAVLAVGTRAAQQAVRHTHVQHHMNGAAAPAPGVPPPDHLQHSEHRCDGAVCAAGHEAAQLRVAPAIRQHQVLAGGRELQRGEALGGAQALRPQHPPWPGAPHVQHAQLIHQLGAAGAGGAAGEREHSVRLWQVWMWCWKAMVCVHVVGKRKCESGVAVVLGSEAGQGWLAGRCWCMLEVARLVYE